jgi:hypothetical protein
VPTGTSRGSPGTGNGETSRNRPQAPHRREAPIRTNCRRRVRGAFTRDRFPRCRGFARDMKFSRYGVPASAGGNHPNPNALESDETCQRDTPQPALNRPWGHVPRAQNLMPLGRVPSGFLGTKADPRTPSVPICEICGCKHLWNVGLGTSSTDLADGHRSGSRV